MPNIQRVHKQSNKRTYPQLLNVPGLGTEAGPKSSETHTSVLSSELCCFLVTWAEIAPKTLAGLSFYKKYGMYFKRQNEKPVRYIPRNGTETGACLPQSQKQGGQQETVKE